MDVRLTPDQKAFARRAIESGRLHSEQDAVQEALALWEERERQRTEFLLTLDDARDSLARGEGRVITQQSMKQLAQEVKEIQARTAPLSCNAPQKSDTAVAVSRRTLLKPVPVASV